MATPLFACVRQNFPEARIIGVVRKYVQGVIEDGPWFDQVIGCDDKTRQGIGELVRALRGLDPDMAFVLSNSFRAALLARLGGAREIYGYRRNLRSFLLADGPKPLRSGGKFVPRPMVDYYLEIARALNLELPASRSPELFVSETLEQEGAKLLDRYGIQAGDRVIGINPGAKFGSSKCWPPESFARLAELLVARWSCKLLLFAGPGEDAIAHAIEEVSQVHVINTAPDRVDLALLKPLIRRCQLLVTNDTGPRHYAVAFGVPVVVIMGPTDPRYTASSLEKTTVLRRELDCSPCHKKVCPLEHQCMLSIGAEEVLEASEQLLARVG